MKGQLVSEQSNAFCIVLKDQVALMVVWAWTLQEDCLEQGVQNTVGTQNGQRDLQWY